MSRLSDDEKRVFTDRIQELEDTLGACRIHVQEFLDNDNERITRLEEENTLLAEHNQALREGIHNEITKFILVYSDSLHPRHIQGLKGIDTLLTGGDDANTG